MVTHYIDILMDLLLVRRLEPWHANVKKRLVKSPRFYVRDSGILHRLLGINAYDALLSNPVLGKSWEGFVIENIHSILPTRAETYFYRTAAGAEIDLGNLWKERLLQGISEHGIFHGITAYPKNKSMILMRKNGLFTISGSGLAPAGGNWQYQAPRSESMTTSHS